MRLCKILRIMATEFDEPNLSFEKTIETAMRERVNFTMA